MWKLQASLFEGHKQILNETLTDPLIGYPSAKAHACEKLGVMGYVPGSVHYEDDTMVQLALRNRNDDSVVGWMTLEEIRWV